MRRAWLAFVAVLLVALGRTLAALGPAPLPPADPPLREQAFAELALHESEMRRHAADDFPADPWSQDDAFHNLEDHRARGFASSHRVPLSDVLDAYDEGLRESHTRGNTALRGTVPPCRPRTIY